MYLVIYYDITMIKGDVDLDKRIKSKKQIF